MHLLPVPKTLTLTNGVCDVTGLYAASFEAAVPEFVKEAYASWLSSDKCTIPLTVCCGEDTTAEDYRLEITRNAVKVSAGGYKGAFYALQTLRQMAADEKTLPCAVVEDAPDLRYRGFYQDVSRGRIPTLDTLKRLVDRLSMLKMNSLQLYVEHTHRFKEYAGIQEELGFYTDEEILELDRYCRERCVELVPSLSCFGHLYKLLQSPQYRHLSEMENYEPTKHDWHERLIHHTIDPANPESEALILSLIGQYLPLFTSSHFNICCDETFDLCKGRNAGGDVAASYVGFVSKLITYLKERGKTVMMWGDIVMQHPEALEKLPEGVVYLNWCYDMEANGLREAYLPAHGCTQVVCPSVHSHKRFLEKIEYSVPNIQNVVERGFKNGALGVLTTNWGDYGHICFDEAMLYGLAFSAAKAWNVEATTVEVFEAAAAPLVYHAHSEVFEILRALNRCDELFLESFGYEKALWELTVQYFDNEHGTPENYDRHKADLQKIDLSAKRAQCQSCRTRLEELKNTGAVDTQIGETLVLAADGMAVVFGLLEAACRDQAYSAELKAELDVWLGAYKALWHKRNQPGEWKLIETFFTENIYELG